MEKMFFYFIYLLITTTAIANPNPDLEKAFAQAFPAANNVRWSDDKDGYFVSFTENSNLEKAFYNKTGEFICSWKYSDGTELPATVVSALSKYYKDFKIIGVTEFSTANNYFFDIKVVTNKYWYSIKVSPYGDVLEKKRYKK